MISTLGRPHAINSSDPMQPYWAEISEIVREAPNVSTYWLKFLDPYLQDGYHFKAGQFNMILVPGVGEAAISISSDMEDDSRLGHTIRSVGNSGIVDIKGFYGLFPGAPMKKAAKIAGIPKPASCV